MPPSTVADKPGVLALIILSLWAAAPMLVDAADASPTAPAAAVNTFVPSCAQGCFQAFLENNEFLDACGGSPSLQCMCTRYGSTGATFGEGALQCMAAERNAGRCATDQIQQNSVTSAYSICNTIPNFASPTQKVITATTIVQTRTFTPTTTSSTRSSSTSASDSQTTLIVAPKTTLRPEPSQPLTDTTPAGSSASPTASPIPTNQAGSTAKLSGVQVAGITIGAVAGVFLLAALVFLARRARQRRLDADTDASGSSYMSSRSGSGGGGGGLVGGPVGGAFSKLRDSWSRGGSKNSETSSRRQSMQISAPVMGEQWASRPYETMVPGAQPIHVHNIAEMDRRDMVGVALSPENRAVDGRFPPDAPLYAAGAVPPRRQSLQYTPPHQGQPFKRQQFSPTGKPSLTLAIPPSRDSDVTEFAEDGEDNDDAAGGAAQIWRPPANDPQSATTYYVADKWGNWRRKSTIKGERPGGGGFDEKLPGGGSQSATVAPLNVPRKLGSPIALKREDGGGHPRSAGAADELSASSSVYSAFSPPQSVHPGAENPMPPFPKSAYAKMLAMNANNLGQQGAVGKLPTGVGVGIGGAMASRGSHHSTTTIADDDTAAGRGDGRNSNSPVSPGVSPVSYPKIPKRDARRSQPQGGQQQNQQEQQQSPRGAVHNMLFPPRNPGHSPPGQPSPTLGAAVPARSASAGNAAVGGASPQVPSQAAGRSLTGGRGAPAAAARAVGPDYGNPYSDGSSSSGGRNKAAAAAGYDNPYSDTVNPYSDGNVARPDAASPDSSLLAKRLGAEKAAALSLVTGDEGEFAGARAEWKRQAPQQGGQPGSVDVLGMGRVPLPSTPGWEPKLTPTRRGEDLFLKVG